MNNPASEPVVCQALGVLIFALAFGPWMTLSGLRVLRDPSSVEEKSFINWVIRTSAARSSLATGNIRFWAWMIFLSGVIGDLIGVLMLVAIVGAMPFH